jgi:peptidyl-prolyl cis-trans isomerase B (cyclophilin B)
MKRIGLILLVVIWICFCTACGETDIISKTSEGEINVSDAERTKGLPVFEIVMENGAVMRGELYPDVAPQSVGNFIALANSGFYDGLIFHRVIPGFMIQGGCPTGTGTGGPGYSIKGEFDANGIQNNLKHTYGVLSMARSQSNNSAGSQFFVMVSDSPHLDRQYAAFGKVLTGMEEADRIVGVNRDGRDKPLENQTIHSIRVETFGKTYPFEQLK